MLEQEWLMVLLCVYAVCLVLDVGYLFTLSVISFLFLSYEVSVSVVV